MEPYSRFETGYAAMRSVVMPEVKCANGKDGKEHKRFELHITPPFTRPSGPVQPRLVKIHERSAIIPMTVKVIANAKTNGWSY